MGNIPVETQATEPSFSGLIGVLVQQTSALIRVEMALIETGIYEKVRAFVSAVSVAVLGMGFGLVGFMALVAAGIIALAAQVGLVVSALIFAVGLTVPALILIRRGFRQWNRHAGR